MNIMEISLSQKNNDIFTNYLVSNAIFFFPLEQCTSMQHSFVHPSIHSFLFVIPLHSKNVPSNVYIAVNDEALVMYNVIHSMFCFLFNPQPPANAPPSRDFGSITILFVETIFRGRQTTFECSESFRLYI